MPIDPSTLKQLIHSQWLPLLYWVGRDRPWAEDVVQEAFVKIAAVEPIPDQPVAWLYRVSRNLAINADIRERNRAAREVHAVIHPEGDAQDYSRDVELSELLDRMHAEQREIIVAHIWGGLSFEEIATATNQNKTKVWRAYQQALAILRPYFEVQTREDIHG